MLDIRLYCNVPWQQPRRRFITVYYCSSWPSTTSASRNVSTWLCCVAPRQCRLGTPSHGSALSWVRGAVSLFLFCRCMRALTRRSGCPHPQRTLVNALGRRSPCSEAAHTSCVDSSVEAAAVSLHSVPLAALTFCESSNVATRGPAHSSSLSQANSKASSRDLRWASSFWRRRAAGSSS